jgi:hypothetical protein
MFAQFFYLWYNRQVNLITAFVLNIYTFWLILGIFLNIVMVVRSGWEYKNIAFPLAVATNILFAPFLLSYNIFNVIKIKTNPPISQ